MAITPAKMKRTDTVILDRDLRKVTSALGMLGVLHLVEVMPEETTAQISRLSPKEDLEKCIALLRRLETICEWLGVGKLSEHEGDSHDTVATVEEKIAALESRVAPLFNEKWKLSAESEEIQDELARLESLGIFSLPLSRIIESPFLHFAIGTMKPADLKRLEAGGRPNIILLERAGNAEKRRVIAITSRKGRFALETILKEHHFEREDLSAAPKGTPAEIVAGLERRLEQIRLRNQELNQLLGESERTASTEIATLYRRLNIEQALIEAQMNFGHTSSTCLISGWLPEEQLSSVSERLLAETGGRLIMQVREAEEAGVAPEDVPVMLKHHSLIRPFELLVSGFGIPRYNEIEPTLIVAISFLVMYGLMFGDVGHGALLAVLGFVMHKRSRSAQIRDIGVIVALSGAAAALGGFLYGSVFGKDMLQPLWLRPMDNVMQLLQLPLVLGVVLISVGVLINIVNKFRNREYLQGILDRFGVVGIIFYWGAVGLGIRYLMSGSKPVKTVQIGLFILLPLAVLLFREPILHLLVKRKRTDGRIASLMHGGVDVMETVSSYLANTVSFARLGAFALAHAGLCTAIFSMEEIVRDLPGGVLWSIAVLVFGNALVLLLEGLIVFVQCLRLEYYEFFGKFFEGSGKRYKPFSTRCERKV